MLDVEGKCGAVLEQLMPYTRYQLHVLTYMGDTKLSASSIVFFETEAGESLFTFLIYEILNMVGKKSIAFLSARRFILISERMVRERSHRNMASA